jgi:uncharacterized membrane protein YgcG
MLLCFVLINHAGASTQDFTVSSFIADYYLSRDAHQASQLTVKEKIVALFPQTDQNHGILRAIPTKYQNHPVDLAVQSITDETGRPWHYSSSDSGGNRVLKIGDASIYVHGQTTYNIAYTLQNVTQNLSDHDEFYWDVNGDQWEQPFNWVEARVHLSSDLAGIVQSQKRCLVGVAGSSSSDCIVGPMQGGQDIVTTRTLGPRETLTFVLGFAKDTFAPYTVPLSRILLIVAAVLFLGLLPPLIALWIVIRNWRRYGRDPKGRGVIVPQYLPPKELSVLASNAILKEKFEPKAISAQIIDLAVRHCLKVYEVGEKRLFSNVEYELEFVGIPAPLRSEEQAVIDALFGASVKAGDRVALADLKYKLYAKAQTIGKSVNRQLAENGYFRRPPDKARQPYVIAGVVLLVSGAVFVPFTFGLAAAGVVLLLGSLIMAARTPQGVEMRDYLYGLREYMKLAEAERIKVLQSPHGTLTEKIPVDPNNKVQLVKLYERLLPYAMLFGIEKDWAKELAPLYENQPDWYAGSGAFQAAAFAASIDSFSAATTASFTPPSDSHSSGFGGGGFAGGGGGGGGGGGW